MSLLRRHHSAARALLMLLLLISGAASTMCAQERKVQNKPYIDERRFHYGFTVGLHDQDINFENNGFITEDGSQWLVENDQHNYGFSVGVLGEWRLSKTFSLRIIPSLHFGSKHLKFRDTATGNTTSQDMKSSYVSVPFDLKIAAPRFNNYRPYIVAGVAPMYDLTTGKHSMLRTKPFQLMLEAGLGCDFYLPFFKLIPELKFCFGLGNVLDTTRDDLTDPTMQVYTQSVSRATTGMVVLSFYFE